MSTKLFLGLTKTIPPTRGLYIHDEVPDIPDALVFDHTVHSFNPLKGMTYRKALDVLDVFKAAFPEGENTLTKATFEYQLLEALLAKPRNLSTLIEDTKETHYTYQKVQRLLMSPVLKRVLCKTPNFFPVRTSATLVRLNRAELGDFDALVLGLFLIGHFKRQLIIPDFGFYGRDTHISLIRENRLIAGVNFLSELTPKLRNAVVLIPDKEASGATFDDAETLAQYARVPKGTNAYNSFIDEAMS